MIKFNSIIELIQSNFYPLPGIDAQHKMAPYARISRKTAFDHDENPNLGATLTLIYPKNNIPHVLLMLRNSYKGVHSAQVSFPGGKVEPHDSSFEQTALREFSEEMGVQNTAINIIGKLTEVYIPPSRFLVHPYVGFANQELQFNPDKKEVAQIIEMPLLQLLDESIIEEKEIYIAMQQMKLKTPAFVVNGHIIWGATAMMLGEFREILKKSVNT